jgi:3-oxoacyl-[acyl-carrier protein] reductase
MAREDVAWLTGAASGLGLHLAQCFIDRGWRVAATDVDIEALDSQARDLGWDSDQVIAAQLDVGDSAAWREVSDTVMRQWGRVDVLVNNAGILHPGWLIEATEEDIDRQMNVNFKGVALGSTVVGRLMREQGKGHIINVSSLAGIAPVPGLGLYAASKSATRAFSRVLADELRTDGVDVTVLCPDAIETPMLRMEEQHEEAAMAFSGNRVLSVDDVARVVFDKILVRKPAQVAIPVWRGLLARLADNLPGVARLMQKSLTRRGRSEQLRRLGAGSAQSKMK